MANPYFNSLTYLKTNFRSNTGQINDITVAGGTAPLTVNWAGPNGFTSGPYVDTTHSLSNLSAGEYIGTVTDSVGAEGTISINIEDKGRLYLSVNEDVTVNNCEGELNIVAFKHNGFDFKYELEDSSGSVISTHNGTNGSEFHQFGSVCDGGYKIVATETQQELYTFDGSNTTTSIVVDDNKFEYEVYVKSREIKNGNCEGSSVFVGDNIFDVTGSTINSYIEAYNKDNLPLNPSEVTINDQIIKSPKPKMGEDIEGIEAAYKISISRKEIVEERMCDYSSFKLDGNGLVLFTHGDGDKNYNISSECCNSLGFNPELDSNNQYVCRWKEVVTDPCATYSITNKVDSNGYYLFIDGDSGALTNELPSSECCTKEGLTFVEENGKYHCKVEVVEETPTCEDYVFTGDFVTSNNPEERYAIFQYDNGTTSTVLSAECCTSNGLVSTLVNGAVNCIEEVEDCTTYTVSKIDSDGYVVFRNSDGIFVNEVDGAECCTNFGYEAEMLDNGNVKCHEPKPVEVLPRLELVERVPDGDECSNMVMKIIGTPNSTVKYRITTLEAGDHGFINSLAHSGSGESISPSQPAPSNGSYCEGSIKVGASGEAEIEMYTCAKPPLRNFNNVCSEVEFLIYDYDNNTINSDNKLRNRVCFPV